MENKNKHIRVGFPTILWAVMAILLCAAPSLRADDVTVPAGETWDIDSTIDGNLIVHGTANLLTGALVQQSLKAYPDSVVNIWPSAFIKQKLFAYPSSVVNIYGGNVGEYIFVTIDPQSPVVTVYGTDFADDDGPLDPSATQWTPTGGSETLKGTYENEDPINLLFMSDIPINLVNTAGVEPLEAQLWVFPGIINRYGPLSKILAIVRLPEGITKDDIDSEQTLVLYAEEEEYDVEIKASCQQIIQWCRNGTVHTTIFASFDKASLTDVVPNGDVELEVVGGLNTDQEEFYGIDTVRIVSWPW